MDVVQTVDSKSSLCMLTDRIQSFGKKVLEGVDYDSLTRDKAKMVQVFRIIRRAQVKVGLRLERRYSQR